MRFEGTAHAYGDDVDTDVILPGPYMDLADPLELGKHALEGLDPGFVQRVQRGDILAAGHNFGCGSSREHAPIALKGAGVSCVIAKGFARIFFRNAINVGLPVMVAPEAVAVVESGDPITVDTDQGRVYVRNQVFEIQPLPPFVNELIAAGGLQAFVRQRLGRVTDR